jgi:hypothetical protein
MSHTHTHTHTYIHICICVCERENPRGRILGVFLDHKNNLHENFNKENTFLQGMKWRAHFGRSVKNCWMRIKFGINFINHGFKRASIKKNYQLQKQKIKTMWSCMIFHAQNLVPTQDDHHCFSELKLMNKSRG